MNTESDIPIIIIAYNQLTYIRNMVNQCVSISDNIIIIDNASTYKPLIDYYDKELPKLNKVKLIRHPENGGSLVYQQYLHLFPDEYIITDPDLLFNPKMPNDVVKILSGLRKKFNAKIIGFALDISDHQDFTDNKFREKSIYDWERAFWKNKIYDEQEEIYAAAIVTTFALHSKSSRNELSLRIAGRFTCKHIPWYRKEKSPLPVNIEEKREYLMDNRTTHWGKEQINVGDIKLKDVADLFFDIYKNMSIESMIDVGTGSNGVVGMHYLDKKGIKRKFAIDICSIKTLPPDWTCIIMDARNIRKRFEDKSIDIIQACDFIEHLEKEEGIKWLRDCEKIARKAILIFTPIGLVDSPAARSQPDNIYQKHKCGWSYEEFENLGFKTAKYDTENMWRNSNIVAWKLLYD